MNTDAELEVWRQQWQADTVVPPDLGKKVARQTRLMKLALLADVFVTVVMGGGTTALAMIWPDLDMELLALATWGFLAAAWFVRVRVNRGNWEPAGLNAAAFLDLSVKRCRSALAAIRFGIGLFVCEVTFALAWVYHRVSEARTPIPLWRVFTSPRADFVWLFTVAFFAGILWYRRKKRAELESLLNLREATGDYSTGTP